LNAQVKILVDFFFQSSIIEVSLTPVNAAALWGMMFFVLAILKFRQRPARASLTYSFAQLR